MSSQTTDAPASHANLELIGIEDLSERLSNSKRTINRKIDAGTFPAPFYIGKRPMWPVRQIEEWIAEQ